METTDPKVLAAARWFGYGRWDAPYWFIGKEPGGTDDPENYACWERLGGTDLIDCRDHDVTYQGVDAGKWHTWEPPHLQPTWRPLIALLLAYRGAATYDKEAARAYQADRWGRLDGETAVLELSAIAVRSTSDPEAMRLTHVDDRIATLKAKIAENRPTFVLFYGVGLDSVNNVFYVDHWNKIVGMMLTENEPTKIGSTVFVFTKHPTAHGISDQFWIDLGKRIRSTADRRETS